MTWKLLQLALLPAALVLLALFVPPRGGALSRRKAAPEPERRFFAGPPPKEPIELPAAAAEVDSSSGWFRVAVLAELPDAGSAARVAGELVALLGSSARHYAAQPAASAALLDEATPAPLTPDEAELFQRHGVSSEIGAGWAGSDPGTAVTRVGRVLILGGLKGDFARLRPNPLRALLERMGARTFAEGDPAGGPQAALDLDCQAPDDARASELAAALDGYLGLPGALHLRPPWHPRGISAEEARARATWVALERAVRQALAGVDLEEVLMRRLHRVRSPEEAEAAALSVQAEIASVALEALDVAAAAGDRDPAVVEELRRGIARIEQDGGALGMGRAWTLHNPEALLRLAPRMGNLSLVLSEDGRLGPRPEERALGAAGRARRDGSRLELGGLRFQRVALGLPALLAWLRAAGCKEARLGVAPALAAE